MLVIVGFDVDDNVGDIVSGFEEPVADLSGNVVACTDSNLGIDVNVQVHVQVGADAADADRVGVEHTLGFADNGMECGPSRP